MVICLNFSFIPFVNAKEKTKLSISSKSAILVDSITGKVIYEKNGFERMYPASLTKIATAIYAIENGHLNDRIKISKDIENIEGTKVYLVAGEQVTLKHLIQGLLINSGNDAGVAIAKYLGGSIPNFTNQLNKFLVEKVEVSATHFVNPHGLFAKNHFTTTFDLAKITNYAIQNQTFKKIFGTKELKWNGRSWKTTLITHHLMLKGELPYREVTGGKTGYVDQSGQTLATTAENDNIHLTVIIMDGKTKREAYNDTKKLLDYGFKHFETTRLRKGITYKIGEDEYKTSKEITFTKPLHAAINEEVSKDGLLNITDKNGISLDESKLSHVSMNTKKEEIKFPPNMEEAQTRKVNLLLIVFLILIGSGILIVKIILRYKKDVK